MHTLFRVEKPHPPSVDVLVRRLADDPLPRSLVVEVVRAAVAEARRPEVAAAPEDLARSALRSLRRTRLSAVINATGVLLHTNLGRAPLHPAAAEAAGGLTETYTNLEFDLDRAERGQRGGYVERLLTTLTGGEAALVVNNNAAGLLLALTALAAGGAVPVSRGELIEIGGSYRLPELMAASTARMVEVGTTNRTRIDDYRKGIDAHTATLLKVHPSNYRLAGFTEEASLAELVALGREAGLPVIYDAGSGLLDAAVPWLPGPPPAWLAGEPGIRQSLEAGAGLVTFSGDKLLGGPQAGLVVGRRDLTETLGRHPLARALRVDGFTLKALEVTLELYAGNRAFELPFWRMATATYRQLEDRTARLVANSGLDARIERGASVVGAGAVPGAEVPSPVVILSGSADARFLALLSAEPPIVARRREGRLIIDLRAVSEAADEHIGAVLAACRS